MSTNVEIDRKQLEKINAILKKTPGALFNRGAMEIIGQNHKDRINIRTLQGKDVKGNPFKPYNAAYALKSGKSGVRDVNLSDTGQMLKGMTVRATNDTATISFNNDRNEKLALKHDQIGVGKQKKVRHFFGISDQDSDNIIDDYQKETQKRLKKIGY